MASTPQTQPGFASPQAERDYIVAQAKRLGLDPQAVLAVAAHEGGSLPAAVGDSGTSFGPWQLHAGGALPAQIWAQGPGAARTWADTQAGIDYALGRMATVAKGLHGPEAVGAIVYGFERPADPASETIAAVGTYQAGGGPRLGSSSGSSLPFQGGFWNPGNWVTILPGEKGAASAVQSAGSLLSFPERAFKFVTSWRFVEVVGGFFLLLVGLYLLGRQFGVSAPTPPAVKAAGGLTDGTFQSPAGAGSDAHYARNREVTGSGGAKPMKSRAAVYDYGSVPY